MLSSVEVSGVVLAAAWAVAGLVVLRGRGARATGLLCLLLAAVHAGAVAWAPLAPVVIAVWLTYAVALPYGRVVGVVRRVLVAMAGAGAAIWTGVLAAGDDAPGTAAYTLAALAAMLVSAVTAGVRLRSDNAEGRRVLQWLAAASTVAAGFAVAVVALRALTGQPGALAAWVAAALVVVPLGQLLAALIPGPAAARFALVQSIGVSAVATLVAVVYLVVVVGIDGSPHGHERAVLLASLVAAVTVALLAVPVRQRVVHSAEQLIGSQAGSPAEVVGTFGARMSRAVPMDELLLQLAETMQATLAGAGAEIWTGSDGVLIRAVSVPSRGAGRLELGEHERMVVGRARMGGPAWTSVWLPDIHAGAEGTEHRVVPVAHLGDLLGLIVVRKPRDAAPFDEDDETALVEVARQLGLALHNVRLDSALQASLAELAQRNEELQASRLRIVAAADASRREIERNLHDGAQQHLVALAVKIGLAGAIAEDGDTASVLTMLEGLRGDVQTTIGELRELAHGIYPPLLRDRGLAEALRTAAIRCPLPCTVDVELPGRYAEQVETAAYFCCLEAMQNAGKYAGEGATLAVHVQGDAKTLCFELVDDGVGFDASTTDFGHGFVNMQDRLGAIGGELQVESALGVGTTVRATIPATPLS